MPSYSRNGWKRSVFCLLFRVLFFSMLSSAFVPRVLTSVDLNVSNSKTANDIRSQTTSFPGFLLNPATRLSWRWSRFRFFSFTLQAAVVLNDILPSLGSMGHWLDDTHIQQVWTVKFHDKTVLLGKLSILLICMDIHIPLAPVVFANVLV